MGWVLLICCSLLGLFARSFYGPNLHPVHICRWVHKWITSVKEMSPLVHSYKIHDSLVDVIRGEAIIAYHVRSFAHVLLEFAKGIDLRLTVGWSELITIWTLDLECCIPVLLKSISDWRAHLMFWYSTEWVKGRCYLVVRDCACILIKLKYVKNIKIRISTSLLGAGLFSNVGIYKIFCLNRALSLVTLPAE